MNYLVTAENNYGERTFTCECTTWEDVKMAAQCAVRDNHDIETIRVWQNIPIKTSVTVETV